MNRSQRLGRHGENFSIARMAERYEKVYEEIFRREAVKRRRLFP
jgi:hypothetical protein